MFIFNKCRAPDFDRLRFPTQSGGETDPLRNMENIFLSLPMSVLISEVEVEMGSGGGSERLPHLISVHPYRMNPPALCLFELAEEETLRERKLEDLLSYSLANNENISILEQLEKSLYDSILLRLYRSEERTILINSSFLHDVQGTVYGLLTLFFDITDQVRKDLELSMIRKNLAEAQRVAKMGNWVWNIEDNSLWWSEEIYRIFGVEKAKVQVDYDLFLGMIHPGDRDDVVGSIDLSLKEGTPYQVRHRVVRPNGEVRYVMEKGELIFEGGRAVRMIGVVQDLTERREWEEQMGLASSVFDNSIEGVIVTDTSSTIEYVNRAFTTITGYDAREALGRKTRMLKSEHHKREFYENLWSTLLSSGRWEGEIWNRRKNGEAYPQWMTLIAIRDEGERVRKYLSIFHDITHIKKSQEMLKYAENHDALTGLPNCTLFRDRLRYALPGRGKSERPGVVVIMVGLDRLKSVNESLGYAAGDQLLTSFSSRIGTLLEEGETMARWAGDEFVLFFRSDTPVHDSVERVSRIKEVLKEPFLIDGYTIHVTASEGVALYPDDGRDEESLIKNAHSAMNSVKEEGGGHYRLYTSSMNQRALEQILLENDLRKALELNEFRLYYQPRVNLSTGEVEGMEALLRWVHPVRGFVSPALFVPLAEMSGQILPMEDWIIREACSFLQGIRERGHSSLRISVNLSARSFRREDLVDSIQETLRITGLPPEGLELEITESLMLENMDVTIHKMEQMRQAGITLSVDDFGTGYSSLSYLKKLPIDKLKIDQSFIRDMHTNGDDADIASAIVALGHRLGLSIVAEGVELPEHVTMLREMRCDEMQGYHFSRPLPGDEFLRLLESQKRLSF